MKMPDPKPRRVKTHGYNSVTIKDCYTRKQMQDCWDASRKEALEDVIERCGQWGDFGKQFVAEMESMK